MRSARFAFAALLPFIFFASPASAERRIALVIGEDAYDRLPADRQLRNAVNDARAVKDALEQLGFAVTLKENLRRADLVDALSDFSARLGKDDVAFFFYAGHGVALNGANYLLPTDIAPPRGAGRDEEARLIDNALAESRVIERIRGAGARVAVVVLDACRDNPLTQTGGRSIGGSRGLEPPPQAEGIMSIYSAGVGQSAWDSLNDQDAAKNSLFTRVFVEVLKTPGLDLQGVARETRRRVSQLAKAAGKTQTPGYYEQIDGEVFLAGRAAASSAPAAPAPPAPVPPAPAPEKPGGGWFAGLFGKPAQEQVALAPPAPVARPLSFDADLDALLASYPEFAFTAAVKTEREKLREAAAGLNDARVQQWTSVVDKAVKSEAEVFSTVLDGTYFPDRDVLDLAVEVGNGASEPIRIGEFRTTDGFRFLNPGVFTTTPDYPDALLAPKGLSTDEMASTLAPGEKKVIVIKVEGYGRVLDFLAQQQRSQSMSAISGNFTFFTPSGRLFANKISGTFTIPAALQHAATDASALTPVTAQYLKDTKYAEFETAVEAFFVRRPAGPLIDYMRRQFGKTRAAVNGLNNANLGRYASSLQEGLQQRKVVVEFIGGKFYADKDSLKLSVKVRNGLKEPIKLGEFVTNAFRFLDPDVFTTAPDYPELLMNARGISLDETPLAPGETKVLSILVTDYDRMTNLRSLGGRASMAYSIDGVLAFFTPSGNRAVTRVAGKINVD